MYVVTVPRSMSPSTWIEEVFHGKFLLVSWLPVDDVAQPHIHPLSHAQMRWLISMYLLTYVYMLYYGGEWSTGYTRVAV